MADFNVLKATIASRIPDNTDQLIDAADVRDSFLDSIDEVNAKKQDKLESGVNIKTINGESLLGSGDIPLAGATEWGDITGDLEDQTDLATALAAKQDVISDLADIRSGAAAGATAYQKPSAGIPGTDLTAGVRSDLNKARSAVQPGDLALVASTGDYDDLLDKPSLATVATSGSYDDLTNKPTIPAAQVQSDWDQADSTAVDYIKNKPTIPPGVTVDQVYDATSANAQSGVAMAGALSGKQDTIADLATIEAGAAAGATAVQPGDLATVATSGSYADLTGTPTIPAAPGTLDTDNSSAQTVSSSEALSGTVKLHKVSKTGSYNDLLNKPSIPAAQVNSDWNAGSGVAQILNKPSLAAVATSGLYSDLTGTPTIPAAPGTLDTDNSSAQTVSSSEALSGTVKLHKVSKTGSYNDLLNKPSIPAAQVNSDWNAGSGVAQILNKPSLAAVATSGLYSDLTGTPTIPTVPTISTDIPTDKASNDKTTGAKAVYDFVKPATGSSIPAGGLLPGVKYHLGTLSGSVTMTLATAGDASVENEYKGDFTADSTPPTITWQGVTEWAGNCLDEDTGLPVLTGGKHYEFNIENGYGLIAEFGV